MKIRLQTDGTSVTMSLNGATVATYDNSAGFYSMGNILLGAADPFNSANGGNGVIIDNVVVHVPEPTTAVLLLGSLSGVALGYRRRR